MSDVLDAVLSWLYGAFTTNLRLKAISLLFSVGLFIYLHGQEKTHLRSVDVDVSVLQPPEKLRRVLMTQMPPSVRVTLRGPVRTLDALTQRRLPAIELDLQDGRRRVVEITQSQFQLPPGVEVTQIEPRRIQLEWQDLIVRRVKLQASITGKPAEGFVVKGEPTVDPATIRVEGPRSVVETMQFARVAAFDVTGKTAGIYRQPLSIDAPPDRSEYLDPPRAEVTVTIERVEASREFDGVLVQVVGITGAQVNPREVTVTVRGAPDIVNALKVNRVVPRADVTDQLTEGHGSATVPLKVDLAGATATVQPPSATVIW